MYFFILLVYLIILNDLPKSLTNLLSVFCVHILAILGCKICTTVTNNGNDSVYILEDSD